MVSFSYQEPFTCAPHISIPIPVTHRDLHSLSRSLTHQGYPFHHTSTPEDNAPIRPWVYQLQSCYFHRIKSRLPLHYYLTPSPQRSTQLSICKLIHDYVHLWPSLLSVRLVFYSSIQGFLPSFSFSNRPLILQAIQAFLFPISSLLVSSAISRSSSSLQIGFWSSLPTLGSSGSLCHHCRQAPLQVSTTRVSSSSSLQASLWTDPLTSSPPYYYRQPLVSPLIPRFLLFFMEKLLDIPSQTRVRPFCISRCLCSPLTQICFSLGISLPIPGSFSTSSCLYKQSVDSLPYISVLFIIQEGLWVACPL